MIFVKSSIYGAKHDVLIRRCNFTLIQALLTLGLLGIGGCGKKAADKGISTSQPQIKPENNEFQQLLDRQELNCDSGKCPEFIAKVGIRVEKELKFCTAFLTDHKTVVTSANCLPDSMKVDNLSCSGDIFLFFNNATSGKTLRVGCKKILKVSTLDGADPVLWRSDVAFLELESPVKSKPITTSRGGMGHFSQFVVWSVDHDNEHTGIIRKSECRTVHGTYFNPLANNESSPVSSLSGCAFVKGNSGSPVLDYRGRVRGLISSPVSPTVVDGMRKAGLLEGKLNPFVHVTNFACAPTLNDNEVLDEAECNKKMNDQVLRDAQMKMLAYEDVFKASMLKMEALLSDTNKYIKLTVNESRENYGLWRLSVSPKCFKNHTRWINEFSGRDAFNVYIDVPERTLKFVMDEIGFLKPLEIDGQTVEHIFQFYPRILKSGRATIFMFGSDRAWLPFPGMTSDCSLL